MVLLERNLYGHPLTGLLWERQLKEVLLGFGWKKYRIGNVCLFIGNKDYSYQYTWMTLNGWQKAEYGSDVEVLGEGCVK